MLAPDLDRVVRRNTLILATTLASIELGVHDVQVACLRIDGAPASEETLKAWKRLGWTLARMPLERTASKTASVWRTVAMSRMQVVPDASSS